MSDLLVLLFVSLPLLVVLGYCVVDVVRRPALSRGRRTVWVAAMLLIPVLGLFAYLIDRPPSGARISGQTGEAPRAEAVVLAAEQRQRGDLDDDGYRAALEAAHAST